MQHPVRFIRLALIPALLALIALVVAFAPASANAAPAASSTVNLPVSFTVQNVNRSLVACHADGNTYTVRGNLVAPASVLSAPQANRAITLYLHGLSFGEFFWNFDAVGGYNYANNMAERGQASLIIDRLGYGASGKPNGFGICAGSRADVAHQIIQDLRSGKYASSGTPATFGQVYLAGHSYGGQIVEIEAYSFGDIDGVIPISYSDVGQTDLTRKSAAYALNVCASGGVSATGGGATGYAPFGNPKGARAALFHDVDPTVLNAALPKLTTDPCGDDMSFNAATAEDLKQVQNIHVPVLLIQGGVDALFTAGARHRQADLFTGAPSVESVIVPHTAHAITLERQHDTFADDMAQWLSSVEAAHKS